MLTYSKSRRKATKVIGMSEEEAKKAYEQLSPEVKALLQGAVFKLLEPIYNEILE